MTREPSEEVATAEATEAPRCPQWQQLCARGQWRASRRKRSVTWSLSRGKLENVNSHVLNIDFFFFFTYLAIFLTKIKTK